MSQSTPKLSDAVRKFGQQLPYLPQTLKLIWHAARWWSVGWVILLLIQGILPAVSVYLTRLLVDGLVAALQTGNGWASLLPVIWLIAAMVLIMLLTEILRSLTTWVRTAQTELVQDHIHQLIHTQALALDLAFFESPDYYDQLHRAKVDALTRPVALLENIGSLTQNAITLIAMLGILLPYGWWLPVLLLFGTLPALGVVLRYTVRFHRWRLHNTANERRTRYYDWLLTQRDTAAELRLFVLGEHFREAFQMLRRKLRDELIALTRQQVWAELTAVGFGFLALAGALGWMLWLAILGAVSLGDMALFYQAFSQGQRLMRTLLSNVGEVYRNIIFLENLYEFLALQPQIAEPEHPQPLPPEITDRIVFDNVTFGYPHAERPALRNFELIVPAGKIVALVGINGAGKSTLIKLLCRFYDPQMGRITVDDINLRNVSPAELRRRITVLFQEPVHYHATAAENIALGDLESEPSPAQIGQAALDAGADSLIRRLPDDYQTLLGRWFGGAELSVGEWQRIALARAFLRQAPLIILDEPTSAMDSWAEVDWLARFRDLAAGRTAIIITHRFTTAMQADEIHVMDYGRVIEAGTHDTLMANNGKYAQSWRMQMRQPAEN